jgi:uncharacterized LabA/DUF88 family protein
MNGRREHERVMVFIDLRNVLKRTKQFRGLGIKMDFGDMVETLTEGRGLAGTYVFDGTGFGDDDSEVLHNELRNIGFRVITRICYDRDSNTQKEIDVAMSCEILSQAYKDSYDSVIIVSGDRDFRPVIEAVQALGKKGEVAGFSEGMSGMLSGSCDVFHDLDPVPMFYRVPKKIEYQGEIALDSFMVMCEVMAC